MMIRTDHLQSWFNFGHVLSWFHNCDTIFGRWNEPILVFLPINSRMRQRNDLKFGIVIYPDNSLNRLWLSRVLLVFELSSEWSIFYGAKRHEFLILSPDLENGWMSWIILAWSCRDHFVYPPNPQEMTLQCNIVSHWLGAFTKRSSNDGSMRTWLCFRIKRLIRDILDALCQVLSSMTQDSCHCVSFLRSVRITIFIMERLVVKNPVNVTRCV